ncbi:MAG: hypothetical protein R6U57_13515 [Anaerolineales bacterium]
MSREETPEELLGEKEGQGEDRPGVLSCLTAPVLVKIIGIYSATAVSLISFFVLASDASLAEKALIKMALGLILIWVILGGSLMYVFRRPVRRFVRKIPLTWQVKFFLFCVLLALLEEGVTVSMTNLAPRFGAEVGEAFVTASAHYLHTVLFHSVIVFLPMFLAWTVLLRTFAFSPAQVFLLFGLTGSIAEMSINPTNVLAGFWFFVYGLMVYLPAYSLPEERGARSPVWWAYLLAVGAPLVSPILLLPFAPLLRYLWEIMDPVFFVDSMWG